ncbi:MAG: acyl-CoA thioesterase [Gemmatimonadaceae bacterium]
MHFTTTEYVRWADVDLAGIMRYDAYLRLVDVAETDFFRAIGAPISTLASRLAVWLPRKVVHMEYHAPARLDDELRLTLRVSGIGRTSVTLDVDVAAAADGGPRASIEMVLVCVGADLKKRELPLELVELLSPYGAAPAA